MAKDSGSDEPDRRLEWSPISEVPEAFRAAVDAGQRALATFLDDDGDEALDALARSWESIVRDPRFPTTPLAFRLDMLNRSAVGLWWRTRGGRSEDLATALERWREALALAPPGWTDTARYLTNAAGVHLHRFQLEGDDDELQRAVELALDAVARCSRAEPLSAIVGYRAADALTVRHRQHGDPDDARRAVEFAEQSVASALALHSPRLGLYLGKLAEVLSRRFDAYGSLDDLERAVAAQERAVAEPAPVVELQSRQAGLGRFLRQRYVVLGDPADIERAVELLRVAPAKGVNAPARLTNLGNALLSLARLREDPANLREAAAAHERAVALTQPGDWQLASRHNNAGNSALALFEATGDADAISHARANYQRAVALTGTTASEMASRQHNLGNAHRLAYERDANGDDLRRGRAAYRAACLAGLARDLNWALGAARAWGVWADRRDAPKESATAYRYGLDALEELFRRQLGREDKESWLRHAEGLAAGAGAALSRAGQLGEAAVALERGRALLLSETLGRDRVALDELERRGRRDLVERYRRASARLREA